MKDKWLEDLKNRMSEFEMDVPDNLWEEIERVELSRAPKRSGQWMVRGKRLAGIAAMVAVVVLFAIFFVAPNPGESNLSESVASMGSSPEGGSLIEKSVGNNLHGLITREEAARRNSQIKMAHGGIVPVKSVKEQSVKEHNTDNKETGNQTSDTELLGGLMDTASTIAGRAEAEDCKSPKYVLSDKGEDNEPKGDKRKASNLPDRPSPLKEGVYNNIASISSKRYSRYSINIFSAGGVNSTISNRSMGEGVATTETNGIEWDDSPLLGILISNQGKEIETKRSHRQPVRIGLSVNYRLTDRLGIEAGLTYTDLTSDLKSGSEFNYISEEQNLHYIGIPVNLSYDVYSWKRLRLYCTGGILAEKCVYGKSVTKYFLNKSDRTEERMDVGEKPFQVSLNLSAGIQFNITEQIGIYAEPGASYYFKDGTDLETIYKEKPLNFNINMGLRLTIGK